MYFIFYYYYNFGGGGWWAESCAHDDFVFNFMIVDVFTYSLCKLIKSFFIILSEIFTYSQAPII